MRWWSALGAALLVACTSAPQPADEVQRSQEAVHGGADATTCAWPNAVRMGSTCSGALIHPEVVVYAGHCGTGYSQVRFGENNGTGYTVATSSCERHPMWSGSFSEWDYAICTLAEPVTDVAIVPPMMGCETDILVAGRPVVMVGWGQSSNGGGAGTKRIAPGVLSSIMYSGTSIAIDGAADDQGLCPGDSGGPTYIQLDDGSWRQLGVHHTASPSCDTSDGGTDKRLYLAVDWIETTTGFDVTPCHDADGTWNPGPDCTAFPLDPAAGGGDWPSCPTGPLSGDVETCGPGLGSGGGGGTGGAGRRRRRRRRRCDPRRLRGNRRDERRRCGARERRRRRSRRRCRRGR